MMAKFKYSSKYFKTSKNVDNLECYAKITLGWP